MSRVALKELLRRSNNNMNSGTHHVVRETALEVIKRAYAEGINVQISEGNRSYARQNELYRQGRTTGGKIVTNARGGQSWHNFGIAVDYFLTTTNGNSAVWTVNRNWRRVAQIGKNLGFEWGGDWRSFKDYPHLQMTGGYSLAQLRAGNRPNLKSKVKNPIKPPSSSGPNASPNEGIVDYMIRNKMDSSIKNRKDLAVKYGIKNYSGTAKQNEKLLGKLKAGVKPSSSSWKKVSGNFTGQGLRKGMYGEPVRQLQQLLADNYYYPKKGAKNNGVDRYFGADTVDALKRYQSQHGLAEDGRAGPAVYKKLKGRKAKPKKAWTGQPLSRGRGSKGAKVTELQKLLIKHNFYPNKKLKNNGVDGRYGPDTENAVRRFQRMTKGLNEDGKAGPATYRKLV